MRVDVDGVGIEFDVSGPRERLEGAGHWLQLDATDRVNDLLLDFLP